jgi:hypothetical protein
MAAVVSSGRFYLWVDAVGGYLVCLGDQVTIGQSGATGRVASGAGRTADRMADSTGTSGGNAMADGNLSCGEGPDIAILAPLSRRHAALHRSAEGYVLEPFYPVSRNGRPLREAEGLMDGDELEIGQGVKLRFRQPHPLSLSAVLEFQGRRKTQPAIDAVVLMADSLVLGPRTHNHIVCRDWKDETVLFRRHGGLACRASGAWRVDGHPAAGPTALRGNSRVAGEDFSFSIESASGA